jgi:hypothetical protein
METIFKVNLETIKQEVNRVNTDYKAISASLANYWAHGGDETVVLMINGKCVSEVTGDNYISMLEQLHLIEDIIMAIPAVQRNKRK